MSPQTVTSDPELSERTREAIALADRVLAPTYRRPERLFTAGEGCWVVDAEGRRYLDLTSGVAVNALGHGSPEVVEALREGAAGLVHTSNLYHTEPAIRLAAALVERSFADRVFFCNSGAESIEGAIKLARLAGGPLRRKVIAFERSFHGRTLGALSITDRPADHKTFGPMPRLCQRLPWNDERALDEIDGFTCAVVVEPIQGEGGIRVPDEGWLRALRHRCNQVRALLVFDEVQCGLGRTGHLWAHEAFGVTPDIMTVAKPLAGGLPMGAVLMTEQVAQAIEPGAHATTFGGGPLVASVALRVLERLSQSDFLREVAAKGDFARETFGAVAGVQGVRGRGLMLGLEVPVPAAEVTAAALERGLLVCPARDDVVRLVPPLTITREELGQAADRLGDALGEVLDRQ